MLKLEREDNHLFDSSPDEQTGRRGIFQRLCICVKLLNMSLSPLRSFNILSRSFKLSPVNIKQKHSLSLNVIPVLKTSSDSACSRSPTYMRQVSVLCSPSTSYRRKRKCKDQVPHSIDSECSLYKIKKHNTLNCEEHIGNRSDPDLSLNTPDRHNLPNAICKNGSQYFLGSGAFGTVLRGNYKGKEVAVKIVPKTKVSSLKSEENALHMSHLNIIKIFKIVKEEDYGLVFMERNFGPNIHDLLHHMCISLTTSDRIRYMLNIAHALEYCHSKKILHLDVKPKNILLSISNNVCKLCDFGCSVHIDDLDYLQKQNLGINSVYYTDPQLLCGERPSPKSDVYSFGITMWQVISQEVPYEGIECHTIMFKVVSENMRPKVMQGTNQHDKRYIDLYQLCWNAQQKLRPEMSFIVEEMNILMKKELENINDKLFG